MFSLDSLSVGHFDETVKTNSITVKTYFGRLLLRTHHKDDTASLASIYSDPFSRKYLQFLQPPNGWGNDKHRKTNRQWTEQDFTDRVRVQNETRANGKSCVFNIILLASESGEQRDRCIGTTGFVTIESNTGYLGIITDQKTTRMGYATEALYTSIVFAFERLGINKIMMQTNEENQEMRGWCEKTAGLKLFYKKPMTVNDYTFTECGYQFTLDEWNNVVKNKLKMKMDNMREVENLPAEVNR